MLISRSAILAVVFALFLAACSGAPATTSSSDAATTVPTFTRAVSLPSNVGPGDTCKDAYVIVTNTARTNFQLGSEYYRTNDYCRAYPYLRSLLENEPLFTNDTPDDRTYLRMAGIYEWFATKVDSADTDAQRVYLDSSLMMRTAGREAMERAGITYDKITRELRDGFFYAQHADVYADAEAKQFDAYNRAFEAAPDSLDDWYLDQLFSGSALRFSEDVAGRSEYIKRLARYVDDPAKQQYIASISEAIIAPAPETGVATDAAVEDLLAKERAGSLNASDARSLLSTAISQPERLTALEVDVSALTSRLVRLRVIVDAVDDPRTLAGLAFQAYGERNTARGNELFARAVANSRTNGMKADLYYSRCVRGFGNCTSDIATVLQLVPNHAQGLYKRASLIAEAVGRPRSTLERAAYWCIADIYRNVAASVNDARVATAARSAAASYDRAAPTREQYFLSPGWEPGQSVTASLGSYGSCTTRVK